MTEPDGTDNDYFDGRLDRSEENRSENGRSEKNAGALYLFDCGY